MSAETASRESRSLRERFLEWLARGFSSVGAGLQADAYPPPRGPTDTVPRGTGVKRDTAGHEDTKP